MTDSPIETETETETDAWRDDADIADDDFFTPLGHDEASRPEGDFRFQGPQGRYNLTWRQEAFARHYAACGNGAEAARRAGYSVASARYIAYENLKDSRIRWRIRAIAERREAQRRAESAYVIRMLNAAMEMALRQELPNTMIRALAHMARLGGLDRPAAAAPACGNDDEESWLEAEAALALLPADAAGVVQAAVLDEPHQAAVASEENHHPGRAGRSSSEAIAQTNPSRGLDGSAPCHSHESPDRLPASGVVLEESHHPGRAGRSSSEAIAQTNPSRGPEDPAETSDAESISAGCAVAVPAPEAGSSDTVPHIPLHSPTSAKNPGDPGAPGQLAAAGAAGRVPPAIQGESAGPEGGKAWSS